MKDQLTVQEELFVREYCKDWNQTRAAIAAGFASSSAHVTAHHLLKKPKVIAKVNSYKAHIFNELDLEVCDIVRDISNVLRADPRELSEQHVGSCRHCWGAYFLYQQTPQEFRNRFAAHQKSEAFLDRREAFDPMGGDGYKRTLAPNPECPECEGLGIKYTVWKDTRDLSPAAAALYMGVKETKNGMEILTRSKDKAAEQMAKYMGMNKETVLVGTAPSGLGHFYGEGEEDGGSSSGD